MLSHWFLLRESKNFTSGRTIEAPQDDSIHHYFQHPVNQRKRDAKGPIPLFHASVFSGARAACLEHSNFFKVMRLADALPTKGHAREGALAPPLPATQALTRAVRSWRGARLAAPASATQNPTPQQHTTTSFLTATTQIYASGAGITAAAGTRLALQ